MAEGAEHFFILTDTADTARRDYLRARIRQFNDEISPAHRASRQPGQIRPLDVYLPDGKGEAVAGLTSDTYWDWWEIDVLWVRADLRRQGYGRQMMQMAEAEARRRGSRHAHLRTFSFQAPDFYARLGFRVVGQLDDYPAGATFYWLRKELD